MITRNGFFGDLWEDFMDASRNNSLLKSDVYEDDDNYVIEIDIPGYTKEDVSIDYENGYIMVTSVRSSSVSDDRYIRKEKFYGEYKRSFYVGEVDENDISATFYNGVLKIIFPKTSVKQEHKKRIEIE